jgi:transcriptional regulator with XRE-family HTH domain
VFAERLSEAIRERGWSQNEAGRYLGVTGKQVGRYISGEQQPTLPVAIRLADRLGVTLDELARRGASQDGGGAGSGCPSTAADRHLSRYASRSSISRTKSSVSNES